MIRLFFGGIRPLPSRSSTMLHEKDVAVCRHLNCFVDFWVLLSMCYSRMHVVEPHCRDVRHTAGVQCIAEATQGSFWKAVAACMAAPGGCLREPPELSQDRGRCGHLSQIQPSPLVFQSVQRLQLSNTADVKSIFKERPRKSVRTCTAAQSEASRRAGVRNPIY